MAGPGDGEFDDPLSHAVTTCGAGLHVVGFPPAAWFAVWNCAASDER